MGPYIFVYICIANYFSKVYKKLLAVITPGEWDLEGGSGRGILSFTTHPFVYFTSGAGEL